MQIRRANLIYSLLVKYPSLLQLGAADIAANLYTRLDIFKDKKTVEDQNLDKMLQAFLKIIELTYANRQDLPHP